MDVRPTEIYAMFDPGSGLIRYIGKTSVGVQKRHKQHLSAAKMGGKDHRDRWIRSAIDDGALPEIAVIEVVPPGQDWATRERHWINVFQRCLGDLLTNTALGGDGLAGIPRTREWIERISAAQRGRKRGPLSAEIRARISAGNRGKSRHISDEHRAKISSALRGRKNGSPSMETREKIGSAHRGKKMPSFTPEQEERWRAAQVRGESHNQAKLTAESVLAIRNESVGGKALAENYGVSYSTIKMVRSRAIWKHI